MEAIVIFFFYYLFIISYYYFKRALSLFFAWIEVIKRLFVAYKDSTIRFCLIKSNYSFGSEF